MQDKYRAAWLLQLPSNSNSTPCPLFAAKGNQLCDASTNHQHIDSHPSNEFLAEVFSLVQSRGHHFWRGSPGATQADCFAGRAGRRAGRQKRLDRKRGGGEIEPFSCDADPPFLMGSFVFFFLSCDGPVAYPHASASPFCLYLYDQQEVGPCDSSKQCYYVHCLNPNEAHSGWCTHIHTFAHTQPPNMAQYTYDHTLTLSHTCAHHNPLRQREDGPRMAIVPKQEKN